MGIIEGLHNNVYIVDKILPVFLITFILDLITHIV